MYVCQINYSYCLIDLNLFNRSPLTLWWLCHLVCAIHNHSFTYVWLAL